jgi:hypothetical protein
VPGFDERRVVECEAIPQVIGEHLLTQAAQCLDPAFVDVVNAEVWARMADEPANDPSPLY